VAEVGSPIALATALLFYFGWVRASVQARELGYDIEVLSLSTTDYVLDSIDVLFLPGVLTLLLVLLVLRIHTVVVATSHFSRRRRLGAVLRRSSPVWTLAGVLGLWVPFTRPIALPVGLTLSVASYLYGDHLRRSSSGPAPRSELRVVAYLLLALVVFWDTERVARSFGTAYAADLRADPDQLAAVTVYSAQSLALDAAGIRETRLEDQEVAYRFRYTGLRLLRRSGAAYVLLPEQWVQQEARVFVLHQGDGMRFEFHRTS
jgi:hypothetical protein